MLDFRRYAAHVFFGTLAFGCGAEPRRSGPTQGWGAPAAPVVTAPPVDPRIAIWGNECADLIGTINAGIGFVGEAKGDAAKSDLSATADALDSVARELEPKRYSHPDLARLAAWYTGVSKGLAATTREADAALAKEDEKAAGEVAAKAEELTKQEDAIVDEINRVCEPFTPPDAPADAPLGEPAPSASVPAAPLPAPPTSAAPTR
jgi:hypothetical protein